MRLIGNHGASTPTHIAHPAHFQPDGIDEWVVGFYLEEFLSRIPGDWAIEVENELAYDYGRFVLTGHQDALGISADGKQAVAADLKRGRVPVDEASANWQILGYACQVLKAYPSLESISYLIVQPLAIPDMGYERVTEVTLEGDRLAHAVPFLTQKINHALDHPFDLETGWKYCRYCDAALQCPALQKLTEAMKLTLTKEHLESLKAHPDLQALGEWVVDRRMLSGLMDKAAALLKDQLEGETLVLDRDGSRITLADRNGPRRIESEPGWLKLVETFEGAPDRCYT